MKNNKKNKKRKNDLRHLSRKELIDLICDMRRPNPSKEAPTIEEAEKEQKRLNRRAAYRQTFRGTAAVLIVVAAISVLVATLWMPVLQIYGSSMSPTLERGQIVISVKNKHLKTGDIVAFWQGNKLLVKRVIAGPGQWVDIDRLGNVSIDGKALDEPYLTDKAYGETNIGLPYQVPDDRYFLMGDNREVSVDSRNTTVGCVARDQIVGKVVFRIWPLKDFGPVG